MATKRKTASKAETPNASAASRLPALEFQNAPKPDGQMADLYIFSTTNDLSGKIGVFAGTRLGPIQIVGIKKSYSMHIKWALLQFSGTGYKAATQPKRYRRQLDDNDIKIVVERVLKQGSKSSLYASLKARLPKFNFVSGQIDWSWGQDKSKSTTETIKSYPYFTLVESLQELTWRIGTVEHGDPRKPGGFLDGPYLDAAEKAQEPYFYMMSAGDVRNKSITATLKVSLAHDDAVKIVEYGKDAESAGIKKIERDVEFTTAFKDYIRKLKLMKSLNLRDPFVIAKDSMHLVPVKDRDYE